MVIMEGLVMCFILLLICVAGIANGPVGLVIFYEQEVKDRVIELGLTTKERIRNTWIITLLALLVPQFVLIFEGMDSETESFGWLVMYLVCALSLTKEE